MLALHNADSENQLLPLCLMHQRQGCWCGAAHLHREQTAEPATALCCDCQAPSPETRADTSDGVFLRLMALHKGRVMLARALRLLNPSPEAEARSSGGGPIRSPPLRLAWALLRNVRVLFTPGGLRAAPGAGQTSHASHVLV